MAGSRAGVRCCGGSHRGPPSAQGPCPPAGREEPGHAGPRCNLPGDGLRRDGAALHPRNRCHCAGVSKVMATKGNTMGLRLIVGADEAGVDYKDKILADLRTDPRVSEVL